MSAQYTNLLADLERERSDIDAELSRLDERRVELIFRRMDVVGAINEIKRLNDWSGMNDEIIN